METEPTTTGRRQPALLAVVVVSLVFGIIGMHALSTHCFMGNTDRVSMSMSADSGADLSSATAEVHAGGTADVAGSPVASRAVPEGGHGSGGMVMLCVAMLVAAAWSILVLLRVARRLSRLWACLPAIDLASFDPFAAPRGTGPPPAWKFSVIRR